MGVRRFIVAGAVLATASCETYEFPPRLNGVGTEDCPDCEELVLSESRLPVSDAAVSARFQFEDELGSLSGVKVYVTTPSGMVVQEEYCAGEDEAPPCDADESLFRDGFTCRFVTDDSESVSPTICELSSDRSNGVLSQSVARRLRGYESGTLTATFGVSIDELGEWTVEVEAERGDDVRSNRLSNTFEVAADVGDDTDTDE